jgi:hypothetical protein
MDDAVLASRAVSDRKPASMSEINIVHSVEDCREQQFQVAANMTVSCMHGGRCDGAEVLKLCERDMMTSESVGSSSTV